MKFLFPVLFSATAFTAPHPKFNLTPPDEGYIVTVACDEQYAEECKYNSELLADMRSINEIVNFNYSKKSKSKRFPGLDQAPGFIVDAIVSAAEAMGDVSYVHVAITHKSTTYEYMYDRSTGWNSFRALSQEEKCTLKCLPFKPTNSGSTEQLQYARGFADNKTMAPDFDNKGQPQRCRT